MRSARDLRQQLAEGCPLRARPLEAVGVLCEDGTQVEKVRAEEDLPRLQHVLTYDDLPALAADGVAFASANPGALEARLAEVDEDDIFTFIYTSGTTGPPKACMIRHRNYAEMVRIAHSVRLTEPGDVLLLFLPLAHNYGRLLHLLSPYVGFTIAFEPEPTAVAETIQDVRPTVLPSVPRLYEKVHTAVLARFDEATKPAVGSSTWARRGRRVSQLEQAGEPVPATLRAQWRLADRLVYQKVRAGFGGRLRARSSAAPCWPRRSWSSSTPWGYASSRGTGSRSARRVRRRTGSTASASAPSGAHYRTSSSVSPRTASF